jgi:hypothetical protein
MEGPKLFFGRGLSGRVEFGGVDRRRRHRGRGRAGGRRQAAVVTVGRPLVLPLQLAALSPIWQRLFSPVGDLGGQAHA